MEIAAFKLTETNRNFLKRTLADRRARRNAKKLKLQADLKQKLKRKKKKSKNNKIQKKKPPVKQKTNEVTKVKNTKKPPETLVNTSGIIKDVVNGIIDKIKDSIEVLKDTVDKIEKKIGFKDTDKETFDKVKIGTYLTIYTAAGSASGRLYSVDNDEIILIDPSGNSVLIPLNKIDGYKEEVNS